jgi:hypothetical protein
MARGDEQTWTKESLKAVYSKRADPELAERLVAALDKVDGLGRLLIATTINPAFGIAGNAGRLALSIREPSGRAIRGRISIFTHSEDEAAHNEYETLRERFLPIKDPKTVENPCCWDFIPLDTLSDDGYRHFLGVLEWLGPVPASDAQVDVPTTREDVVISRIVRDSAMVRRLKQLYENRCQICGTQVTGVHGWTYAEAHHVRPLGDPHGGPDVEDNLLILCPNHHAACDFGAIKLDTSKLRFAPGHTVQPAHIRYHNERILRKLD